MTRDRQYDDKGSLHDTNDNMLLDDCRLEEAKDHLRDRNWQGGRCAWVPFADDVDAVEFD